MTGGGQQEDRGETFSTHGHSGLSIANGTRWATMFLYVIIWAKKKRTVYSVQRDKNLT